MEFLSMVLITGAVFSAWYLFFCRVGLRDQAPSDRWVASLIMGSGQIILSEIGLGQFGFLTVKHAVLFNVGFSGLLLGFMLWKTGGGLREVFGIPGNPFNAPPVPRRFGGDFNTGGGVMTWWREVKGWENYVLLFFLGVLMLWLGSAAYLLPPRSFDDVYHLPPIFEYLVHHRIFLLPLEIRSQFAFPENGEFLFLWPLLFLHDARAVDLVQMVMAWVGGAVVYHLAVRLGGTKRSALFMGLLFPFIPVVIGQAASSNIDLIVSVYFLAALSMAVCFWKEGCPAYFFLAGMACGLLMGMKYSMVLFGLGLQPLLFFPFVGRFDRKKWVYGSFYLFLLFLGGGYWYLRNWVVLGNPVWPLEI